ncbi:hypothetical protein [Pseudomonas chlororaphis]|uniref:hypothetical protein n=1 Tax=Pseudomonas chlororaphis TaxID=587753 RepID=UPI002368D0BC|nr:hypothetical protein [Pseudomonas chlororaphis]WDG45684.1 hypothetical protein PUP58_18140 [Pseudomonas chlororaphis]
MRPHPAQHINKVLDETLSKLADLVPVEEGTREFHQSAAEKAALLVRLSYSEPAKKKARNDCMSHLRASLSRSAATETSDFNNVQCGA